MFGFFNWMRQAVKAAILGGVQDAADELLTGARGDVPPVTLRLSFRATDGDVPAATKRRKAE